MLDGLALGMTSGLALGLIAAAAGTVSPVPYSHTDNLPFARSALAAMMLGGLVGVALAALAGAQLLGPLIGPLILACDGTILKVRLLGHGKRQSVAWTV